MGLPKAKVSIPLIAQSPSSCQEAKGQRLLSPFSQLFGLTVITYRRIVILGIHSTPPTNRGLGPGEAYHEVGVIGRGINLKQRTMLIDCIKLRICLPSSCSLKIFCISAKVCNRVLDMTASV
ncbi:hypothetical protein M404DRAFT_733064 [Pisolithus tinctorius Marx 270]|uniref:Uncharacterized protein n=1 Tax=Pisolithus tinctorius Marx 270 TaxID=870435 RepID=A0A0C3P2A0_PISTI|nr:hypothetical protein M404DRAFT_733064 [Pisolithus tinctorius Marx 270]